MPNIVAVQELVNGPRNLILKVDIVGDGVGEIDEPLVEVGAYDCGEVRLDAISGQVDGFDVSLDWDGTTRVPMTTIYDGNPVSDSYLRIGGLTNPKMANYTGDVNITSSGLGLGETGSLVFHFYKKSIP